MTDDESPSSSFESTEFLRLKALWYRKLKKTGFQDIESPSGKSLKYYTIPRLFREYSEEQFEEKQTYYRLASQLLHDHPFPSRLHRRIWLLHQDGCSLREIARQLRNKRNTINKDNVRAVVNIYACIVRGQMKREEAEAHRD